LTSAIKKLKTLAGWLQWRNVMYASVESDREYAHNAGMDHPDRAWILAPSDAWYPNPFYHGPAVAHPEDYLEDEDEAATAEAGYYEWRKTNDVFADEIPF
jgi:hypothetical protein